MASVFRTPFTDPFGHLMTHQNNGFCKDFELNYYECMEVHGTPRGHEKCRDYMADFEECVTKKKQKLRFEAMVKERDRQVKAGTRSPKDKYLHAPDIDMVTIE